MRQSVPQSQIRYVNHTPTEREKIEQIFTKWGVSDPWGLA